YYSKSGNEMVFESVSSPPDIINRLYGTDHIKVWHDILEEEEALATKLDEEVAQEVVVLDSRLNSSGNGLGPNGQPGRNRPTGPPRRAPGTDPAFQPTGPPGR
ncbi:MAG: hypothetical protein O7G85_04530, partial [Planctomycetota bacterium]|nr:hypothetical protein [Planctomycetota bacterium]